MESGEGQAAIFVANGICQSSAPSAAAMPTTLFIVR